MKTFVAIFALVFVAGCSSVPANGIPNTGKRIPINQPSPSTE